MKKYFIIIMLLVQLKMHSQNKLLEAINLDLNALLAGFFGALLLLRKEKGKTWYDNLLILTTGSTSSGFLAPFVIESLNIQSKNAIPFFGFMIGFGSIKITQFLVDKYFTTKTEELEPKQEQNETTSN